MILTIMFINIIKLIYVRRQFNHHLIISGGQYCIAQCEPNLEVIYLIYAQETQEN